MTVCWAATALAQGNWEVLRADPPLRVEARRGDDHGYYEFKVTARSAASPLALAEAVWRWDAKGTEARLIERRLVVSEGPAERLVWSLVRPPLVSKRESLVRFTRADVDHGAVQIVFESEAGDSPFAAPAVRALVRGLWRFTPDGAGGTLVEHRILSDPGGGLAPWLVKGAQQDLVIAMVREALQRAERTLR